MRITRHQMFMEFARTASKRSTCKRLNVGAVVVHQNSVVGIGYNGVASGEPHCSAKSCPGKGACLRTVHAEINALLHIRGEYPMNSLSIYTTHSPCPDCYIAIIKDLRISKIYYEVPYRKTEHLLNTTHQTIYQVMPAGYLLDHKTGDIIDGPT